MTLTPFSAGDADAGYHRRDGRPESEAKMARRDLTGAVDFAYLEAYAGGDLGVVEEVLALFREQAEMWLRLLDPHAPGQGWRDAVHTLKGSARGIGATALGAVCEAAEKAAPNTESRSLERVRDDLDRVLADIAAYTHELALRSLKTPPV
jgi:HPt (histidine-containing phosphotransfer) domain-containing protein